MSGGRPGRASPAERRRAAGAGAVLAVSLPLLALLAGAAPVRAQGLEGQPIESVEYRGLEALAEESLSYYLGIELGSTYHASELNQRIHDLWERQLIEDIRVEAEPVEGGVALVVTVRERPVLRSVEYEGLKKISRSDVIERISKDQIRVREGEPLNRGELQRLESVIEELYAEKGFRLADASYVIEQVGGERRVIFSVDEGDKVRIEDIDFEGNTVYSDRRLRWAMKKTKESGLFTRLFKYDIYKPATLEEDLDKVRQLYKRAGYKNVVLGEPRVEIRAKNPGAPTLRRQNRRLYLTLPVEEGARWKLGEISVEGNERFPEEMLLRQFDRPDGGWLRSKVIDKGIETIDELYKNTGHLFAVVAPEIVEREDQVADVVVHIDEGDQFRIGRIEFQGNTRTKDKVLRRELGIHESLVLNSGALRNSLRRIGQLEYFQVDEDDPVAFDFETEAQTVDVTIKGQEGDRTELLFGAGFSEIDGFFGQLSFRTRNFLGRGETLGVSVQSGARQDVFDISYQVPWFLDRPQSLGVQVFSRDLDYDLLAGQRINQSTSGGTISYGRRLGLFSNVSMSYSSYSSTDQRRTLAIDGQLVDQEFERDVSSLRLLWSRDRRDSRLQPTVGTRFSASVELAGGPLGGSTDFWRPRATVSFFQPLTKTGLLTVGALNVEGGFMEPIDDSEFFFLDRFYLGGENSIRGFNYRGIWARDRDGRTITDESGFPLGGDRFLQANLEYHLVLGGPFRILGFFDAGNVWIEEQGIDLGRLRYTAGLELQVNVPLFGAPLRFIYARNLDPYPDDRFESFQFSIGPSF